MSTNSSVDRALHAIATYAEFLGSLLTDERFLFVIVFGVIVPFLGIWAIIAILSRWLHPFWGAGLGLLSAVGCAYYAYSEIQFCNAPPTLVSNSGDPNDLGMVIFNCDAPWGLYIVVYANFLLPILCVALVILTIMHFRSGLKQTRRVGDKA